MTPAMSTPLGQATSHCLHVAHCQSASVTASYNGSFQSASIALVAAMQVTSLTCNQSGLMSAGTATCSVTLSQTASANTLVSLSSNSALLTVPVNVTVPAGSNTASFTTTAGTITADTSGVITSALGTSSMIDTMLLWSTPALSSLACTPASLKVGGGSTCTVTLSKTAGAITIGVSANNAALTVPASVIVPQGATTATFMGTAVSVPSGWVILSASYNGTTKSAIITISASSSQAVTVPDAAASPDAASAPTTARVTSLVCTPKTLTAGKSGLCRIALDGVGEAVATLALSSSNDSIQLPSAITTRPGLSSVEFRIDTALAPSAGSAEITASLGAETVQDTVAIERRRGPGLSLPQRKLVKPGTEVRFTVGTETGNQLSPDSLPAGASFDPATGIFDWAPTAAQEGTHRVVFNALSPTGEVTTEAVELEVDGGAPSITRVVNAASQSREAVCGAGAIGRLEGRWLTGESTAAAVDSSGSAPRLSGTAVRVNGEAVPVLYASATRVDFVCPDSVPGSQLAIVVETPAGSSRPVQTMARDLAPGIFAIDSSEAGQGMVLHGDGTLVMVRNYQYVAQPAQPGDLVTLYATGMEETKASVRIGDTEIEPESVSEVPGVPGLWRVAFRVPSVEAGTAVGVSLEARTANGTKGLSNQIRIAIEAPGR